MKIFKNKLFISVSIIVLIIVIGGGAVFAIKQKKLAQTEPEATPVDLPSADISTPTISKTAFGVNSRTNIIDRGEPVEINFSFNGLEDGGAGAGGADVVLAIDRSLSMSRDYFPPSGERCNFISTDGTPFGGQFQDSRLCWAKKAAMEFIDEASKSSASIKIGLIMFSASNETKTGIVDTRPNYPRYVFSNLKDIKDAGQRKELEDILIGPQYPFPEQASTAQGKGLGIARDELNRHGREGSKKVIILLGDGVGNWPPYFANCMRNPDIGPAQGCPESPGDNDADIWPNNWSFGDEGNRCCRLNPCRVRWGFLVNFCPSFGPGERDPMYPVFDTSIAADVLRKGYNIYTVGYHQGGARWNDETMLRIAQETNPGVDPPPFFDNTEPDKLGEIFTQILSLITGGRTGAPISVTETLPAGSSIAQGDVVVTRGGARINPGVQIGRDAAGRPIVTISIGSQHYAVNTPFDQQRFNVRLRISSAGIAEQCFDADQNYNCSNGQKVDPSVSKVIWSFPISGRAPVSADLPKRCICFRGAQYTGDVFGTAILNYIFPGIDVAVASGGINGGAPSQAVWDLASYNFSQTSISNYNTFAGYMNLLIEDMIERARFHSVAVGIGAILLDPNPDYEVYPEGRIYHIRNTNRPQRLSGSYSVGSGQSQRRATIILEGDLIIGDAFATSIVKSHPSNNVVIIAKGNVTITGNVERMDLGVLAPFGNITVQNSSNRIEINGFLVGRTINLRTVGSNQQYIRYDSQFSLYPPPGPSKVNLPIYWEVAP